ncbi:F0F1 ATP synthase subunit epsilon [Alloscardovia criceti]|uniref:F0F1 ATP synthase subunit epsilon n=1 Tax=Alloscardovia criceti TaxID=356828 RepID=UPI0003651212|nr:F0F1 ATP synthase subunit epsilon [Alloscardovia criceti]
MAGTTAAPIMDVNIIAEDRPLSTCKAVSAVVPTTQGHMGILPEHEPILALLGQGKIKVKRENGDIDTFIVNGGFVSFDNNTLTVGVDGVPGVDYKKED